MSREDRRQRLPEAMDRLSVGGSAGASGEPSPVTKERHRSTGNSPVARRRVFGSVAGFPIRSLLVINFFQPEGRVGGRHGQPVFTGVRLSGNAGLGASATGNGRTFVRQGSSSSIIHPH